MLETSALGEEAELFRRRAVAEEMEQEEIEHLVGNDCYLCRLRSNVRR